MRIFLQIVRVQRGERSKRRRVFKAKRRIDRKLSGKEDLNT